MTGFSQKDIIQLWKSTTINYAWEQNAMERIYKTFSV